MEKEKEGDPLNYVPVSSFDHGRLRAEQLLAARFLALSRRRFLRFCYPFLFVIQEYFDPEIKIRPPTSNPRNTRGPSASCDPLCTQLCSLLCARGAAHSSILRRNPSSCCPAEGQKATRPCAVGAGCCTSFTGTAHLSSRFAHMLRRWDSLAAKQQSRSTYKFENVPASKSSTGGRRQGGRGG